MKKSALAIMMAVLGGATLAHGETMPLDKSVTPGCDGVAELAAGGAFTGSLVIDKDTTIRGGGDVKSSTLSTIILAEGESIVVRPNVHLKMENVRIKMFGAKGTGIEVGVGATGDFSNLTIDGGYYALHYLAGSTGHLDHITASNQQEAIAHDGNGSITLTDSTISSAAVAALNLSVVNHNSPMSLSLNDDQFINGGLGIQSPGASIVDMEGCSFEGFVKGAVGPLAIQADHTTFTDNGIHADLGNPGNGLTDTFRNCAFHGGVDGLRGDSTHAHLYTCTFDGQSNSAITLVGYSGTSDDPFSLVDVTISDEGRYGVNATGGNIDLRHVSCNNCPDPFTFVNYYAIKLYMADIAVTRSSGHSVQYAIFLNAAAGCVFERLAFSTDGYGIEALNGSQFTLLDSNISNANSVHLHAGAHATITGSTLAKVIIQPDSANDSTSCLLENNVIGAMDITGTGPHTIRNNRINYMVANNLQAGTVIEGNVFYGRWSNIATFFLENSSNFTLSDNLFYDGDVGLSLQNVSDIELLRNCFGNSGGLYASGATISGTSNYFDQSNGLKMASGSASLSQSAWVLCDVEIDAGAAATFNHCSFSGYLTGITNETLACPAPEQDRTIATNCYWGDASGPHDSCLGYYGGGEANRNTEAIPFLAVPNMDVFDKISTINAGGGSDPWVTVIVPSSLSTGLYFIRPSAADAEPAPPHVLDPRPVYLWATGAFAGTQLAFLSEADLSTATFAHYNRETQKFDRSVPVTTDSTLPGRWVVRTKGDELISGTWYFVDGSGHPDIALLTPTGDLWIAQSSLNGQLAAPQQFSTSGFYQDSDAKFQTVTGDFNGDGLMDLAAIDQFGKLSGEFNVEPNHFDPGRVDFRSEGWRYDPEIGWRVFAGDFNGDGKTDLVQLTEYTDQVWVGLSDGATIPNPTPAGTVGFRYRPLAGYWIGVADMNHDGRDDLIQCQPEGDCWVALATSAGAFDNATKWGSTGFHWSLADHSGIIAGDYNGDGYTDLAYVTPYTDVWVALSTGHGLQTPKRWGYPNFKDGYATRNGADPACFAVDINGDGAADLLNLTGDGEIWDVTSTETKFNQSAKFATLGFRDNNYVGGYQTYFGNFANANTPAKRAAAAAAAAISRSSGAASRGAAILPTPTPSLTPTPGVQ